MKPFASVRNRDRVRAIELGIIRRVAKKCGVSKGTVSLTFSNQIHKPNPKVVRALQIELARIKQFFNGRSHANGANGSNPVSAGQ